MVFGALADRMGVDPTNRRLRMVNAVWSAIIVTACGDLTPETTSGPLGPELAQRISESYDQFRGARDHRTLTGDQPPAGARMS